MGRNRSFDEEEVLRLATARFLVYGYEATSVDDLLEATGLHRGSLYQAFGSKRGVFVAALEQLVRELPEVLRAETVTIERLATRPIVDLVLVAALELAPHDAQVRDQVGRAGQLIEQALAPVSASPTSGWDAGVTTSAVALGARLWQRAQQDKAAFPSSSTT